MAKDTRRTWRVRAVSIAESVESAREAARVIDIGASTAIRWIKRRTTTGSVEAKPGTDRREPRDQLALLTTGPRRRSQSLPRRSAT